VCDQIWSDWKGSPACQSVAARVPCSDCSRHFRSHAFFHNYKKPGGTNVERAFVTCSTCDELITTDGKSKDGIASAINDTV
jgi:hypothetical protein